MSLLSFLSFREKIELQLTNKFSYNILVGRVWTRFNLRPRFLYFFWHQGMKFDQVIFEYDCAIGTVKKRKDDDLNLLGCLTCLVRNSLYAYYTLNQKGCFKRYDFLVTVG